jgi:molybdopterin-binding protein
MGTVMAQATIDLGNGNEIIAAITVDFVERLGLEVGSEAIASTKATEVMMATP